MSNALPLPCHAPEEGGDRPCADPRGTLLATVMGSSLVFAVGSIVNVALPQMQETFGASAAGAQWIVNAYLLPLGALVLIGGALGDHYGRRRVFVAGLALFAAACLLCALAPTFPILLAGRVLEGMGAALIAPTSLAILSDAFSGRARGAAVGTWAGAGAAAGALAPVLGGAIVDGLGWRWAFAAVIPVTLAALWFALRAVRESRAEHSNRAPLDWAGAALATGSLLALCWGLVALPERGATTTVLGALGGGVVLGGLFLAVERRRGDGAMTPPTLFADHAFRGLSIFTFLLYAALGGLLLLLPYVLIEGAGYASTAAGAALLPFPLLMGVLSRYAGGTLADRFGARILLSVGAALATLGFALFALMPADGLRYVVHVLPSLVALALGMSLAVAPLTSAVLAAAGGGYAGVASGVNNAISRIGGLIATALLGLVLMGASDDLLSGFATAAWAGAGLAALAAGIAWRMLPPDRPDDATA